MRHCSNSDGLLPFRAETTKECRVPIDLRPTRPQPKSRIRESGALVEPNPNGMALIELTELPEDGE
jgi:hypothetical protein